MNPKDIKLNSVNWEHGMLLTPDHFLRQERYFDSMLLWALRYASNSSGLVGGGPRLPESEIGAARHDPVVSLHEDEETLTISVAHCRGITPAGCIIEINPSSPITRTFPRQELEGVQESSVYLVCQPHEKQPVEGEPDEFNPQMQTERGWAVRLALQPAAESTAYALVAGRIRRQRYGTGFEKNPDYIPACTTMAGHSELAAGYRKIVEEATFLAERYAELHRAMREYLMLFTERGIETEVDTQTVQFVDRMVAGLQECVYDLLDYSQPPQRFFGQLRRFLHSAAVHFDLTPGMQNYYETLKEVGETEFIQLINQQKRILRTTRTWKVNEDLGVEVRAALASLNALQRLERALEGKYVDFRVSPQLEAMNFVFDRGGNVLYKLAAKPSRVQGAGDDLVTFFSQLRLEGRDKYRLILVGETNAPFEKGLRIPAEIRINEGSGFQRAPMNLTSEAVIAGQANFEFDFEAPDVPTITDIRVAVPAHIPIRTALLFNRHRFYAGRAQEQARPVQPMERAPEPPAVPMGGQPSAPAPPPQYYAPPPAAPPPPAHAAPPPPAPPMEEPRKGGAPWEIFRRATGAPAPPEPPPQQPPQPPQQRPPAAPRPRFDQGEEGAPPPPPRRRRLE
ncbi:MAG: hypothetical protein HZB13_02525 [Acidobacteria bacterium]|nr:hypothetical protein [Acidobacteriota bacterium]